jgi:hypothetical protein
MGESSGLSASDVLALTRENNNGFGGDWSWLIGLLVVAGIFGNGFGGFGGGFGGGGAGLQGLATRADINEGFALNNITGGIQAIQQGICDSTYALNNTITNGFFGVDRGLNGLSAQLAQCCCDNRAGLADLKYTIATESCDTRRAIADASRDIKEFLVNDKLATLSAENQALRFKASQAEQNTFITANQTAQTAELIRRLGADCPTPAYIVPNPNCCYNYNVTGFGYGNNGCGCNNY